MPAAQIVCPKCRHSLSVAGLPAGQKAACPKCGSAFLVPPPLPSAAVSRAMPPPLPAPDPSRATPAPSAQTAAPVETSVTPAGTPAAPTAPAPVAAPEMIGSYQVRGKLGEGAFGVVYRGFDPVLRRDVAIKMLKASAASQKHLERFLREAQVVGQMHHGNIVPVYQLVQIGDAYYIVSAFIPGRPLDDAIPENGMDPARAARLVVQLLEALAYAHQRGVLHRDIKPANAMLDGEDHLYLMDFGLAGLLDQADTRMTQDGTIMGTVSYMPPEQARGTIEEVGPAADQYSAGVVLFELLTGRVPFVAPSIHAVIYNVIHITPPRPTELRPGLDPKLEAICLRALAKSPKGRFPDCSAFTEALRGWLADSDAVPVSPEPDVVPVSPADGARAPKKRAAGGSTLRVSRHGSSTSRAGRQPAPAPPAAPPATARPPWWVWLIITAVAVPLLVAAGYLLLARSGSKSDPAPGSKEVRKMPW